MQVHCKIYSVEYAVCELFSGHMSIRGVVSRRPTKKHLIKGECTYRFVDRKQSTICMTNRW
ncbi:hypothetical protein BS50DRAFT_102215 [Corynespora cassiicola Philippines]|uniref:Uncharacterized protein n=1 Tax=Corynespora cassiicola Philippines TaxID=1448308 RepID=A0A2T2NCA5_CORCC|nr:hypothetical protein BS50DRAFT_102215 [Corynespora cassiicola Philippines]